MPINKKDYPENWEEIRAKVLARAGGAQRDPRVGARCELCGVQNYSVGYRNSEGGFMLAGGGHYYLNMMYRYSYKDARLAADIWNKVELRRKHVVIILTVAHWFDHDPMNCELDNLKAACQKCHNNHDQEMRVANRKETLRLKEAGQFNFKMEAK